MRKDRDKLMNEIALGEILGSYLLSPPEEDRKDHWDLAIKFDVKSIPNEHSVPYQRGFRWVEIKNVNGEDGWLLGKSDFIAFETDRYWIFVPRTKLLLHVKKSCGGWMTQREFKKNPEPYKFWKREGRQDLVTLIPLLDLCYLGTIVPKEA
jgi:hypothetical protein